MFENVNNLTILKSLSVTNNLDVLAESLWNDKHDDEEKELSSRLALYPLMDKPIIILLEYKKAFLA